MSERDFRIADLAFSGDLLEQLWQMRPGSVRIRYDPEAVNVPCNDACRAGQRHTDQCTVAESRANVAIFYARVGQNRGGVMREAAEVLSLVASLFLPGWLL